MLTVSSTKNNQNHGTRFLNACQSVGGQASKTGFRIYKSRHRFLYKGEWNHYGELHVSCCRRAVENFVINDAAYLDAILTCGERVDGSSLFPFIEAGSSDLYVIPRFCTAFIDPFAEQPTLSMLCSFFNKDGEPLESSPEHTLRKACRAFTEVTGMEFQAMGELEYYVISEDSGMFPATDQRGYHESAPYAKFNEFRTECMAYIAQAGGQIKYGHSEVGNFTLDGKIYEQNEIEFLPVRAEQAADQLMIAKWIIRNLAYQYGYDITFAPKITAGKAGSGLHIHMRIMKDGKNQKRPARRLRE